MFRALLLVVSLGSLAGCLPSTIGLSCDEIATAQCEKCYVTCASGMGLPGDALCSAPAGSSQDACVQELSAQCQDAASVRESANAELDACMEALAPETGDGQTCVELYETYALDGEHPTRQCRLFL